MIQTTRRTFLASLIGAACAPALVKAASLMPVSSRALLPASQTVFLDARASYGFYNGMTLELYQGGKFVGARQIVDCRGSGGVYTIDAPWTIEPSLGICEMRVIAVQPEPELSLRLEDAPPVLRHEREMGIRFDAMYKMRVEKIYR